MMPLREMVLLFLAAAVLPYAVAQANAAASPPPPADYSYGDYGPSMAIIIVVLVSAFFFMGFFTIYVRHCVEVAGVASQNRFYTSVHLRLNHRGLDPEIIDSFPIFHYSDVKEHKIGKGALECAVCICEFEDDDALRLLPKCDHVFHPECIDAWLSSHATCPVCRANLKPMTEETDGNETDQGVESIHATAPAEEQNNRSEIGEIGETQNQISITIEEDESGDHQEAIETPTPTQKGNRQGGVKFPRSNSTGHSLVEPGECSERYTLRLPEELRTQILNRRLKRTTSCIIVCRTDGSLRRGNRNGDGEGSNRGRLPEWLSRTPPFLSRNRGFMLSPKRVFDGEVTPLGPSKLFLTSVITPFDCLAVNGDGVGQTSFHPQV